VSSLLTPINGPREPEWCSPGLREAVVLACDVALNSRVSGGEEFAESVVGTSTVDGGRPTLHEEADADRFGRLFFGCSCENGAPCVCGDATVAPVHHPDDQVASQRRCK